MHHAYFRPLPWRVREGTASRRARGRPHHPENVPICLIISAGHAPLCHHGLDLFENVVIIGRVLGGIVEIFEQAGQTGEIIPDRVLAVEGPAAGGDLVQGVERHFLPFERYGIVHRVERVLLQIDHIEKQRLLLGDEIVQRHPGLAGHLHHLLDRVPLLQKPLHLLHAGAPVRIYISGN